MLEYVGYGDKKLGEQKVNCIAIKDDSNKSRVDLIPADVLLTVGIAFKYGGEKYSDNNWTKGFKYSRLTGAALRHIYSWQTGEDRDAESKIHHIDHAISNLMMLRATILRGIGEDDRVKNKK